MVIKRMEGSEDGSVWVSGLPNIPKHQTRVGE